MKPRVYTVWNVDGTSVQHERQEQATLEELQEWVGGYIEHVHRHETQFFVNEEGLLHGMSRNAKWPEFVGPVVEIPRGFRT